MFWFYAGIIFSIFITVASIVLLIAVWISWRKEPPRKKGEKTAYVCGIDPVAPTIIGLCSTVFPIVGCFIGKMSGALIVWIFAGLSLVFLVINLWISYPYSHSIYFHEKVTIKKPLQPVREYEYTQLTVKMNIINFGEGNIGGNRRFGGDRSYKERYGMMYREPITIYENEQEIFFFNENYRDFERAKKLILQRFPKDRVEYWKDDKEKREGNRKLHKLWNLRWKRRVEEGKLITKILFAPITYPVKWIVKLFKKKK